jgi:hypothetical protein
VLDCEVALWLAPAGQVEGYKSKGNCRIIYEEFASEAVWGTVEWGKPLMPLPDSGPWLRLMGLARLVPGCTGMASIGPG